jgi:hypothetical protein
MTGTRMTKAQACRGANMMATHAVNHGTKQNNIEPALEEMR